jgi:hypothetical protein
MSSSEQIWEYLILILCIPCILRVSQDLLQVMLLFGRVSLQAPLSGLNNVTMHFLHCILLLLDGLKRHIMSVILLNIDVNW